MNRDEWIKRKDELNTEFKALLDNPRADEILTNEWLHDDTLPIPSVGLIELVSVQLLHDAGRFDWFHKAADKGLLQAIRLFLKQSRDYTSEIRERMVKISVGRMHLYSFVLGLNQDTLGWWLAKGSFEFDDFEGTVLPVGKSRLARCMLELLTLRAFHSNDLPQLEGLCEVTRIKIGQGEQHLSSSQLVAKNMFVWLPFLTKKLGRSPSATEMKWFLLELDPNLPKSHTTWAKAHKNYFLWDKSPRSRKVARDQIWKIANEAKKDGPKVKRERTWRSPPKSSNK